MNRRRPCLQAIFLPHKETEGLPARGERSRRHKLVEDKSSIICPPQKGVLQGLFFRAYLYAVVLLRVTGL
ncbi:hypothetical protein B296_00044852 [Ensete ventricosum]|uniref:Uncharacterized protein n=1 Tax=Ensete ventricosum TaxID=4639 RepID=A0A426WZC7_ENSVE|nr:hypothetical protein B296_00044852 [Ensete ventricosum]